MNAETPYRHAFTYSLPEDLAVLPGQGVLVPFGPRILQGVVLSVGPTSAFAGEVRPIQAVAAELPLLLPHQIQLALWLSERYLAPSFACAALMLPPGVERKTRVRLVPVDGVQPRDETERLLLATVRELAPADPDLIQQRLSLPRLKTRIEQMVRRGQLQRTYLLDLPSVRPRVERWVRLTGKAGRCTCAAPIVQRLKEFGGGLPRAEARRLPEWSDAAAGELVAEGLIEHVEVQIQRDPLAGRDLPLEHAPALTLSQQEVLERILGRGNPSSASAPSRQGDGKGEGAPVWLLHGVTGSGKTEVYLAAAAAVLATGERDIVLVPEIALTPQVIARFAGRFPGRVAVLHSGLSAGQRYDQWHAIRAGRFDIVIGSRSAIFAPVEKLGLLILDEEHEWTYKQQDRSPRYHARDVAERLAALTGTRVVLGSATPDVVSYHRARRGRYRLLELSQRVGQQSGSSRWQEESLPEVEVVDLARELREGNDSIFSRLLQQSLAQTLVRGEQAILFLNRRGSASFLLCRDCGHVPHCGRCSVSLTHHAVPQRLLCHQCGRHRPVPSRCPACGGTRIRFLGLGTQRVEEEVRRQFPEARVLRWDRDAARRGADHEAIFGRLQRGEADIIVGTQMVAKSLDLPRVTLVGVVSADISLNIPDYHSGERAFQLLTQVAGRAGRRERRGSVILQTYSPAHYALQCASQHDYAAFYRQEIEYRRASFYPPFARLTRLVYAHSSARLAEEESNRLAVRLRHSIEERSMVDSEVLGPAPCLLARLRSRYRWQILLRTPAPGRLLRDLPLPPGWSVDIDPQSFS
ncbi:MAG: replication restart helicase PriA [Dehalococcoidia bacterium]